jgi:hypothetical protein
VEGSAPFSSAGTTAEAVSAFLGRLQKAVAADDRKTVVALADYPLRAWNGKRTVMVRDRHELLALYSSVFRNDLRKAILSARVETAFANWQGVMWESGRFWIRADQDGTLRIVTINQPASAQP